MKNHREQNKTYSIKFLMNKRDLRASGLSLLPLALRPLLLVFLMLGFCFILQNSYTNNVSAASLTLTIPNSISLDINPSSNSGFSKSSPSTLNVKTDVDYGYTLSIKTKDSANSNNLVNGASKLSSIGFAMSESDFSSSAASNTWGYLPSKLASSSNSNFQPGPTSEPTVLDTTDSKSDGTDYNFTLAAKVDNTIPTGNYTNTFVLTATSNEPQIPTTMQNFGNYCDEMTEHQSLTLTDTRDKNQYTVSKLKDDQCWMTKNLMISDYTLTSGDSDVESDFVLPSSSISGFSSYNNANVYVTSNYGGYYTWYAATAGEGVQSKTSGNTSHSICPKGWRLPTADEYDTLISKGEVTATSFQLGGYYGNSTAYRQDYYGYYWSSEAYTDNAGYIIVYYNNFSDTSWNFNKFYGMSVRCLARSDPKEVGTMQTVDEWSSSITSGKVVISKDVRDNKEYTVARLDDGKLWMTKNLEIGREGEETHLSSDTSDTAGDFTLPASSTNGFNKNDTANIYIDSTYGGYYSWYAATAGEGTENKPSGNTTHSICPKGWRLPTKSEYDNLVSKQGSSNMTKSPANFMIGGLYDDGNHSKTYYGLYWSSTVPTAEYYYGLQVADSSGLTPPEITEEAGKYRGLSVRCVAEKDNYSSGGGGTVVVPE